MNLLYQSFIFYIFLLYMCQSCFAFCSTTFRSIVHCLDKRKCSQSMGDGNWKGRKMQGRDIVGIYFEMLQKLIPMKDWKETHNSTLPSPCLCFLSVPFLKLLRLMSIQTTYISTCFGHLYEIICQFMQVAWICKHPVLEYPTSMSSLFGTAEF